MPSAEKRVVILGTGGTIAGLSASPAQHQGYRAAQLGVQALADAVPALAGRALECEQVAQLDSKDMDHATWLRLAERTAWHLARDEVAGVVVTHGTDTLEETAYFLHRVLAPHKPLVLTAAMRPASALGADGPQNLLDAVTVACVPGAQGVVVAFGGRVLAATDVRKVHGYRMEAFSAGDAGPLALIVDGQVRVLREWPAQPAHRAAGRLADPAGWPVVEIVTSHAGARGETLDALVAAGARGLVVAGTGNGSLNASLLRAAERAMAAGVRVLRASRCQLGGVVGEAPDQPPSAGELTAPQARVELLLDLLAAR